MSQSSLEQIKFDDREDQIRNLAEGKIDAQDIIKINELSVQVTDQLKDSGTIFTNEDQARWLKKLEKARSKNNHLEIKTIADEIQQERQEIEQMVSDYTREISGKRALFGVDKKRGVNTAREYIDEFKGQTVEGKKVWLQKLSGEIDGLQELYDEASKLVPDQMKVFGTMRRHEKQTFLDQLKSGNNAIKQVEKLLEENTELFDADEIKAYKSKIKDTIPEKQEKFVGELIKEIAERQQLVDQHERKLESKYLCKEERAEAKAYIKDAKTSQKNRMKALKMLDKQVNDAKKLTDEFEDLIQVLPAGEKAAQTKAFYEKPYLEKKAQIEKLLKNDYPEHYAEKLEKEEKDGNISKETKDDFEAWFKEQSREGQRNAFQFFESEMAPRRDITRAFNNLPVDIKELDAKLAAKKGKPEFTKLGYHDRVERISMLLELKETKKKMSNDNGIALDKISENGPVKDLVFEGTLHEGKQQYTEAIKCYQKVLELTEPDRPEFKFAEQRIADIYKKLGIRPISTAKGNTPEISDIELTQMAEKAANDNAQLYDERTEILTEKQLVETVHQSDLRQQTPHAEGKNKHLGSAGLKDIQKDLAEQEDMTLGRDGKAIKFIDLDLRRHQFLNEEGKIGLRKEAAQLQTAQNRREQTEHVRITNDDREISGDIARENLKARTVKFEAKWDQAITKELNSKGIKPKNETEASKLQQRVAKARQAAEQKEILLKERRKVG